MPGITGIISNKLNGNEERMLDVMIQTMMHEQFYTSCRYTNSQLGVFVGGVCIKGSFADCMPIQNEKKNLVMFFSGECFGDDDVIEELKIKNHEVRNYNAEYLIHLYEEYGEKFIKNLNGWFNGIIIDLQKENAFIFNDRYGMQRVYYHETKSSFFFSSEAKALLKAMPHLRNIDLQSMGEYFSYDCILNNRTYFPEIFLFPGGSIWSFFKNKIDKKQYHAPCIWENLPTLGKTQFLYELRETFRKILPRYFSGSSIGMSLTGGLDTRMILSSINAEPGELPCYTFGGMYRDSFDVRVARKVARACNQTHHVLRVDKGFLNEFPAHAERAVFLTDGLTNVTASHAIYLNKLAREISPIRMTGKFGSQVMRSLVGLRERFSNERLFNPDFKKYIALANKTFSEVQKDHKLSIFLFCEIPWFWAGFTAAELSQLTVRTPFLDNDLVKLLYQAPNGVLDGPDFQLNFIESTSPELRSIMTDKGQGSDAVPLKEKPLKYIYKFLSMADKVYTWDRVPWNLHHLVARADYLLSPLHAAKLVRGFGYYCNYRTWFRDDLSEYILEMINDNRTLNRPYWDRKMLKRVVEDHIKGKGNYVNEIRKVLTLELIHRVLLEEI